ncbi:CPXCG motif-containing cysteine-rich protein [Antarcticibacterium arcticum]|uniref:CPXCG motif-containing cysteine-rich protein n=1 Tax=Antarcticibacterium arcticum TaxID=2585771 RepID=A0A5B8YK45_9FLAO|nr:CPXCG motif-containing cysteine-rich protein [Antarcticibacterium arcticum]QED38025.1 CPXCG motif-containing cysteine-rich protein [Antarcticibacterium arcticum]
MYEHYFQCPYCWEEISMLLDTSVSRQTYVEDCEICCNPIEIRVGFRDNILTEFEAVNLEQ